MPMQLDLHGTARSFFTGSHFIKQSKGTIMPTASAAEFTNLPHSTNDLVARFQASNPTAGSSWPNKLGEKTASRSQA